MKSAVVMLILLGCDCDGVACEYIRTVSADWSSLESCEAAAGNEASFATESYPLVVSHCAVEASPQLEPTEDSEISLPETGLEKDEGATWAHRAASLADIPAQLGRQSTGWMVSTAKALAAAATSRLGVSIASRVSVPPM
ncbi:MAG: hypothetical protein ACT6RL_19925 [Neoaquamicrobium sediminum]|uniref:hypothetical protein n=1 Tax=Neoaquamicrobium sediminum TaxID=1849104 RepID=UPI004035B053